MSTSLQYNISIPYFFLFFSSVKKKYNYYSQINDFFVNNEGIMLITLTKHHRTWCSNVKSNLLTLGIGINKNFYIDGYYTSVYNSFINYLTFNYNKNTNLIFVANFSHGNVIRSYNLINKIYYTVEKKEIFLKSIIFMSFMLNFKTDSWFNIGVTNFYSNTNKYKIYPYIDIIVNLTFRTKKNQLFDKKIYRDSKIRNI